MSHECIAIQHSTLLYVTPSPLFCVHFRSNLTKISIKLIGKSCSLPLSQFISPNIFLYFRFLDVLHKAYPAFLFLLMQSLSLFSTNHIWNYFNKIETRHINSFQDILIETHSIQKIVLLKKKYSTALPSQSCLSEKTVVQYPSSPFILYPTYPQYNCHTDSYHYRQRIRSFQTHQCPCLSFLLC